MSIKMNRSVRFLLLVFSLDALTGCEKSSSSSKVLRVGFVPAENAQQVIQNAQPIVDILQKRLSMEVQPFVATDYTGVIEALRGNKLDIAFLTPASYVLAKSEANVKVVLKSERKGSPFYYAPIITRAASAPTSGSKNWKICAGRPLPSAIRFRLRPMSFPVRCSANMGSIRSGISNRFLTPAVMTPRFWPCSMAKLTPAPLMQTPRTTTT